MGGERVCRMHGAGGGRPVVHGRYSRVLSKLRGQYEATLRDENLLDLREPLAVLDLIASRLMERLVELDSPAWRVRARELLAESQKAARDGDAARAEELRGELSRHLERGCAEDATLDRLAVHLDRLSKRIEGAWTVRLSKGEAMNKRELSAVFMRLMELIVVEVGPSHGARLARRIEAEILTPNRLGSGPDGYPAPPSASETEGD